MLNGILKMNYLIHKHVLNWPRRRSCCYYYYYYYYYSITYTKRYLHTIYITYSVVFQQIALFSI